MPVVAPKSQEGCVGTHVTTEGQRPGDAWDAARIPPNTVDPIMDGGVQVRKVTTSIWLPNLSLNQDMGKNICKDPCAKL